MRRYALAGVSNARDLGGLKTMDGRTVKRGCIIRSGALWKVTETDVSLLQSVPLKTIVDFRTDREIREKPDLEVPGAQYVRCPILQELTGVTRELDDDGVPAYFRMAMNIGLDAETFMAGLYRPLVESDYSRAHYREFFHLLMAHEKGALLYHCTIGKDRVGVGTMLLLSALGVDRETIMEDYMLTNTYTVQDRLAVCNEIREYTDDPAAVFAMEAFESVRPAYLETAYQSVESEFGSVDRYLSEVVGVGDAERALLREKYLV